MTRSISRGLNELKLDTVAVDKLLETSSTANYSKRAHRIKNAHMDNMDNMSLLLLLLYITHLHGHSLAIAFSCIPEQKI